MTRRKTTPLPKFAVGDRIVAWANCPVGPMYTEGDEVTVMLIIPGATVPFIYEVEQDDGHTYTTTGIYWDKAVLR